MSLACRAALSVAFSTADDTALVLRREAAGGGPGGNGVNGLGQDAQRFWKMLDEMADSDPEAYKKFIDKQMEGAKDLIPKEMQGEGPDGKPSSAGDERKGTYKQAAQGKARAESHEKPEILTRDVSAEKASDVESESGIKLPGLDTELGNGQPRQRPAIWELSSTETKRDYKLEKGFTPDGNPTYILTAEFPEVSGAGEIDVEVSEKLISLSITDGTRLDCPLSEAVDKEADTVAKFSKKKKRLTLEVPIKR